MELTEFLSANPIPVIGEDVVGVAPDPGDVQLTGRIEAADDHDILLRLGDSVVRIARDDVVEVEDDPGRPLIEPGAVYARLRVRAGARTRIETVVPVDTLAGVGLRPMVAAQASLAPQYAVRSTQQFPALGRSPTGVYPNDPNRPKLVYPNDPNRPGLASRTTVWHTVETTTWQCPVSTVTDGLITEDFADDHIGDTPIDHGDE